MPQPKKQNKIKRGIGAWTFLVGVILAVLLGLLSGLDINTSEGLTAIWLWIIVIIGIVIGVLNISEEEVEPFLIANAVLIIASAFGLTLFTTPEGVIVAGTSILLKILQSLLALFVPATIIVAIKRVMELVRH